ncbi:hypothetical protein NC652_006396 [Populus alba x Populus x berolinensis]|nr:hypothetical protein NC652_006396 [Populus alba x Populus x berolinensis]
MHSREAFLCHSEVTLLIMALPQHQFQQHYQPQQQQQSKNSRKVYAIDGQISPAVAYLNPSNLQDQSQHPPYVPPCKFPNFSLFTALFIFQAKKP